MSIIFEALDKLEKTKQVSNTPVFDKHEEENNKPARALKSFLLNKDKRYLIYTIVLISGFFIVHAGVSLLYKNNNINVKEPSYLSKAAPMPNLAVSSSNPSKDLNIAKILGVDYISSGSSKLVLNGIAFSLNSKENFALINNKVVKEGDEINGELISQISEDWVELQSKDSKKYKLYSCYDKNKWR